MSRYKSEIIVSWNWDRTTIQVRQSRNRYARIELSIKETADPLNQLLGVRSVELKARVHY
jgi:hypothetical protein